MKKLLIITQTVDADDPVLGFFVAWIRQFAASCDVDVIARKVGRHDLPQNVRIHSLGAERGASKIGRWFRFWKFLSSTLPESDAVFVHMCPEYVVAGAPWFALSKKPVVLWYTHKSVTTMLRLAERLVDKILTASPESFRLQSKKVVVTGHGIPFAVIPTKAGIQKEFRLLTVGRVAQTKGLHVIVEALAKLTDIDWTYDIVGSPVLDEDRAYTSRLKDRAAALGISDRVNFIGPMPPDRLSDVYAAHDLFLHASETGSLDKVLLEAVGSGLPILTSSEAADFLPPDMHFPKGDSEALAAGVHAWRERIQKGVRAPQELVDRVRREHGLAGLITRILDLCFSKS